MARAVADPVEAAHFIAGVGVDMAAIGEVGAIFAIVEAARQLERASVLLARLRDEVDDAARRVAGEGRGRAAANRFDAGERQVVADEDVGIAEDDVAEFQHRQAVLLQLQELRTTRGDRQAADRDIGIAFAARCLDADAGQVAQDFGGVARRDLRGEIGVERADRDRRVEAIAPLGDAGDDDVLTLIGRRRGVGLRGIVRCRIRRRGRDLRMGGAGDQQRGSGQQIMASLHAILPDTDSLSKSARPPIA